MIRFDLILCLFNYCLDGPQQQLQQSESENAKTIYINDPTGITIFLAIFLMVVILTLSIVIFIVLSAM